MKAARIHRFGAPDVIIVEDVPRPLPAEGEVLVRVAAAGVGPWDAIKAITGYEGLTVSADRCGNNCASKAASSNSAGNGQ